MTWSGSKSLSLYSPQKRRASGTIKIVDVSCTRTKAEATAISRKQFTS
jgi:hypothetical protein